MNLRSITSSFFLCHKICTAQLQQSSIAYFPGQFWVGFWFWNRVMSLSNIYLIEGVNFIYIKLSPPGLLTEPWSRSSAPWTCSRVFFLSESKRESNSLHTEETTEGHELRLVWWNIRAFFINCTFATFTVCNMRRKRQFLACPNW